MPSKKSAFLEIENPDIPAEVRASFQSLPTEDDLPYDDGEPMETARHRDQMNVLIESLKAFWKKDRRYYVGGNMFMHYELKPKRKFRGPDFYLVMDVDDRERKSWVVWQEQMRFPDVIIELLSASTRKIDKGEKVRLYEQTFHTSEYYLFDPFSHEFFGYHLHDRRYERVEPDEENRMYSPVTDLFLAVREGWLRWLTREGRIVPTPAERAEEESRRADEESRRADEQARRADEQARRADEQAQRAEEQARRADDEARRADEEARRAHDVENLLAEYRQRYGDLK